MRGAVVNVELALTWTTPPSPTLAQELEMRPFLVESPDESGRGIDLPDARRREIEREASARNLTIFGAFSLRRQFLRQNAGGDANVFYSTLSMGDASAAKKHAERFEALVKAWLELKNVPFITEEQLALSGSSCTPDFLIIGRRVLINGVSIRWIDAKTYFAAACLADDGKLPIGKCLAQAKRYNSAFAQRADETGAFIFLAGVGADTHLALSLSRIGGPRHNAPLLLAASPTLDTSLIYESVGDSF